ncbi:class I SAM-dependent methyltransferase [Dongia rigui]|uniref:50S ribosomal protein L11 methyltransferase n=1 Tax=Dongia rigui TaxID=940149 RepID=A0ABU5DVK3_9PROT|nr:50S ribosomal protein L11 methyltransferase [Dongia rigui]MDY0871243.1 50S ribosomal protein L11 methyltransferase [Dongia rigui]
MSDPTSFIRAQTKIARPSLVPELKLHLATEISPIWRATQKELDDLGLPPPYWAFCWPGGQALTRYLIDDPKSVKGKRVLDFAAGSGLSGIAAARAGAASVIAAEIDDFAAEAIRLNADLNKTRIEVVTQDLVGRMDLGLDLVLAGDVCYERPMAERVFAWFEQLAEAGVTVLMGDPGRAYLPRKGLTEVARYQVPTSIELEDKDMRLTLVWRIGKGDVA